MRKYLRRLIKYPALFSLLLFGSLVAICTSFIVGIRSKRVIAQYWFRALLIVLNIKLEINGLNKQSDDNFLVANHISWLDIPVISACLPVCFLSKSEVRRWPVIGLLARFVDTLFIARASRRAVASVNQNIKASLLNRHTVCVFPEGTTTSGDRLGNFHPSIFQPAVEISVKVLPVAIRYVDAKRNPTTTPAYVGNMTLMKSIDRIIIEPIIFAEVSFLKPIDTRELKRDHIAKVSRDMIFSSLFK